ncbi:MAG: NYN domain-containing protein [Nanoarchaeota archaeon]|nr:NYN domain-containing protein [Nanoarchaeota archaeon]MBU1269886.1 NYN domain-containing protein [Nanoarchaeota archaeon]MBU1603936.1 NYN domain-containing protein [Nanoarchaeota archaeon]MBU2442553.1 NYN domain-containing protein [Nanoarchaeota archaeon]
MGTKHKEQRVALFVDVQNMYYSAMNLYKAKVNFTNILKTAVSERKLIRAFAYVIEADMKGEDKFHERLELIGFEVKSKELQTFVGGAKKGDWDVGIAMDVLRMAPKVDTIILVSGDGDFADLLKYVKSLGCRAEVISFKKTTSSKLLAETDDFIDMSLDKKKFLI